MNKIRGHYTQSLGRLSLSAIACSDVALLALGLRQRERENQSWTGEQIEPNVIYGLPFGFLGGLRVVAPPAGELREAREARPTPLL